MRALFSPDARPPFFLRRDEEEAEAAEAEIKAREAELAKLRKESERKQKEEEERRRKESEVRIAFKTFLASNCVGSTVCPLRRVCVSDPSGNRCLVFS